MNARWFFSLAAVSAAAVAGCGEPSSAKFVLSERTKKLAPTASAAVEGELQRSFGDPNRLVAWQKLPVDFGEFDGVVEAAPQRVTDAFTVQLERQAAVGRPAQAGSIHGGGSRLDVGLQRRPGRRDQGERAADQFSGRRLRPPIVAIAGCA